MQVEFIEDLQECLANECSEIAPEMLQNFNLRYVTVTYFEHLIKWY